MASRYMMLVFSTFSFKTSWERGSHHWSFSVLQDYMDYKRFICEAYKGTPKPSACTESSMGRIRKVKMDLLDSLYGEKSFKAKLSRVLPAILSWLQWSKIVHLVLDHMLLFRNPKVNLYFIVWRCIVVERRKKYVMYDFCLISVWSLYLSMLNN